jgi:hypothetical protein
MKKLKVFDIRTIDGFNKAEQYKFKLENDGFKPIIEMGLKRCKIYL